jgi:hypothetical protein
MTVRTYASPLAFKTALETRLRQRHGGPALARGRQLLIFDRFLARVTAVLGDTAMLKGGLVLELRLERARTTKDVDLRLMGSPDTALARLQAAARLDLGDFLNFEIGPDLDHPQLLNDGIQYEGRRFRAMCSLAGKAYGRAFGVDVVFAEPLFGEPDMTTAEDLLDFIGVAPPRLRLYPIETHTAEKLHAYTLPRTRPNSRVKDLPDIALLASVRRLDAMRLRGAFEQTFSFRATHPLPIELPSPNPSWQAPYGNLASSDQLCWPTLDAVTTAAKAFIDPVLAGAFEGSWEPSTWRWETHSTVVEPRAIIQA